MREAPVYVQLFSILADFAMPVKKITIFLLSAVICAGNLIHHARADDVPRELRGSGHPVPRFVTLGSDKVYVRAGPAKSYPVKFVLNKEGLPVEIIQEFDVWRKVRDVDGDEGWVSKSLLSNKRAVVIQARTPVNMREDGSADARIIARVENGVIAKLEKCVPVRCRISAGSYTGWVERNFLWGVYPTEETQ